MVSRKWAGGGGSDARGKNPFVCLTWGARELKNARL